MDNRLDSDTGNDGGSIGGTVKLEFMRTVAQPGSSRGLRPLLTQQAMLYKEHCKWFNPKSSDAAEVEEPLEKEEEDKLNLRMRPLDSDATASWCFG